jgi:hypothetical protein
MQIIAAFPAFILLTVASAKYAFGQGFDQTLDELWISFKRQHNKFYTSDAEDLHRYRT